LQIDSLDDLEVDALGEQSEFPFSAAIDQIMVDLSERCFESNLNFFSDKNCVHDRRKSLRLFGLQIDSLDDLEVDALYNRRVELLSARGCLSAISILSSIYLPGAFVCKGYPFRCSRLEPDSFFFISDLPSSEHLYFVRPDREWHLERQRDFLKSSKQFTSFPYEVVLSNPNVGIHLGRSSNLSVPSSWENRRLTCRISPK
jgi:hypothetical protein